MPSQLQVQFDQTPNPATMKFSFGRPIADESAEFLSPAQTKRSPLAAKIFGFPWVAGFFVGSDFVTVTKQDWVDWDIIAEPLASLLEEHVLSGEAVLLPEVVTPKNDDSEEVRLIKQIFSDEIQPAVAMDGGDISFHKYEDKIVYVYLRGSCSGCPSSMITLKDGVEARLKSSIPEIKEVIAL